MTCPIDVAAICEPCAVGLHLCHECCPAQKLFERIILEARPHGCRESIAYLGLCVTCHVCVAGLVYCYSKCGFDQVTPDVTGVCDQGWVHHERFRLIIVSYFKAPNRAAGRLRTLDPDPACSAGGLKA